VFVVYEHIYWPSVAYGHISRKKAPKESRVVNDNKRKGSRGTYAGHPNLTAQHARIVSPSPYPSVAYISGTNRGKPKPQT
jgi:hypothetical protein